MVEHCAPALAGLKLGNLFRYESDRESELYATVAYWDARLSSFGIRLSVLKNCPQHKSFLVYLYREKRLREALCQTEISDFLIARGYMPSSTSTLLDELSQRLCLSESFPHEIGVFLGYPLEDVIGFIENGGRDSACLGFWKVYGDSAKAEKTFESYRKCIKIYKRLHICGRSVMRLAVAG